ncbi:hypothetical protein Tco_1257066 [Tanacetum coccineum]
MFGDEWNKGIMPTKIELTLEQSQQGVSNDVLDSYKDGDGDTSFQQIRIHCHMLMLNLQRHTISIKIQESESSNLKTKTFANSDIQDLPLRYQEYQDKDCQGRLLESFLDDAKYEHVGQDTRSQGGKDDQDKQGKYLEILKQQTKLKDNEKGSRSKFAKHEGTSLQHNKDQRLKN